MADINVERKGPSIWPWIVGLLVLALLIWALVEMFGGQDDTTVAPMRQELTAGGIEEARTAADVENAINQKGTLMVVVNSICGCAAGRMRPGVRAAIQSGVRPDRMITVFAGQDREATDAARSHFTGFPPTSPSIALMRDGKLVYMMQRHDIEVSDPNTIATRLKQAFEKHCAKEAVSN